MFFVFDFLISIIHYWVQTNDVMCLDDVKWYKIDLFPHCEATNTHNEWEKLAWSFLMEEKVACCFPFNI